MSVQNPASLSGPRGYASILQSQIFDIGTVKREGIFSAGFVNLCDSLYFLFVDLRSGIHISPIWFARYYDHSTLFISSQDSKNAWSYPCELQICLTQSCFHFDCGERDGWVCELWIGLHRAWLQMEGSFLGTGSFFLIALSHVLVNSGSHDIWESSLKCCVFSVPPKILACLPVYTLLLCYCAHVVSVAQLVICMHSSGCLCLALMCGGCTTLQLSAGGLYHRLPYQTISCTLLWLQSWMGWGMFGSYYWCFGMHDPFAYGTEFDKTRNCVLVISILPWPQ